MGLPPTMDKTSCPLHSELLPYVHMDFGQKHASSDQIFLENSFPACSSSVFSDRKVHITQGDHEGRSMIISWVTPIEKYPNVVTYWEVGTKHLHKLQTHSKITTYRYYNYASSYIHHATIKDLTFDTKYFYEVVSNEVTRQFSFTTPPKPGPDVPYTFGVIGDLGQTADSNQTLEHYMSNPIKGQAVLFVGDLSYADDHPNHDNTKWDTFGRFIEKSVAYQPWIWSAGNHEIDLASNLEETAILSSHICTALMYPTRHPRVLPDFGIQLSVHRHISLFFLLTQPMGNIPRNTNGLNKSSQRLTVMKLHGSLLFYMLYGTIATTTITWKDKV